MPKYILEAWAGVDEKIHFRVGTDSLAIAVIEYGKMINARNTRVELYEDNELILGWVYTGALLHGKVEYIKPGSDLIEMGDDDLKLRKPLRVEVISGKVDYDIHGVVFDDVAKGLFVGTDNVEETIGSYYEKNIRVTIETLPEDGD